MQEAETRDIVFFTEHTLGEEQQKQGKDR